MGITRDIGFTMPAIQETIMVTCSMVVSTVAASTAPTFFGLTTTVDVLNTTGGPLVVGGTSTVFGFVAGRVIDRLISPLGAGYYGAHPSAYIRATRGSTAADRRIQLGVKLQHGDSSGGGDMADFSTDRQPAIRTYGTSIRTTDMLNWDNAGGTAGGRSTGVWDLASNPAFYNLDTAKRFLRVVVMAGKDAVTTESTSDEQCRVGATITFVGADSLPQYGDLGKADPFSTSTSTA